MHITCGEYIYIFANFCKKLSSKVKKATLSAWHSRALKLHWCFMLQWTCSTKSCLVLVYLVEDFPWILILNQKLTSPNSYFPFCRAVFKYYILLTFQSPRESLISFISMEKLGKFTNSVIFNSFKPKSVTDKIYSSRNNAAKEYEEINNPRYVFCWGYNRNNNSSTSKVANFSLAIVSTKQNV